MNQIDYILLSAKTSHEALKSLYSFQKQKQPNFSLTILGRKLGISSKGHISDMIRGRRSISRKHWSILSQVFDLSETQTHVFHCLLERDHSKCDQQKSYFDKQLKSLESMLTNRFDPEALPKVKTPTKAAKELVEAFNIFPEEPSFRDFLDYFGRHRYKEIEIALSYLLDHGYVIENDSCYRLTQNLSFPVENLGQQPDYLKANFIEGCEQIDRFGHKPEQAVFSSDVLSLSPDQYQGLLNEMSSYLNKLKSQSNTNDAKHLIKMNVQLYPLGSNEANS